MNQIEQLMHYLIKKGWVLLDAYDESGKLTSDTSKIIEMTWTKNETIFGFSSQFKNSFAKWIDDLSVHENRSAWDIAKDILNPSFTELEVEILNDMVNEGRTKSLTEMYDVEDKQAEEIIEKARKVLGLPKE